MASVDVRRPRIRGRPSTLPRSMPRSMPISTPRQKPKTPVGTLRSSSGSSSSGNIVVTTIYDLANGVASIITTRYTGYLIVTSIITPVTTLLNTNYKVITDILSSYYFAGKLVTVLSVPTNITALSGILTSLVYGQPYTSIVTQMGSSGGSSGGGGGGGSGGGHGNVHTR
jgi:hypothetical protein